MKDLSMGESIFWIIAAIAIISGFACGGLVIGLIVWACVFPIARIVGVSTRL